MEKSPDKIRVQNDDFLGEVKNRNFNVVLLLGTKIINKVGKQKIVFVVIYGESFHNYAFSASGNNSFFIADFSDLKGWAEISQELVTHSHKEYKKQTIKPKYSFHVETEPNMYVLKRHLEDLKNSTTKKKTNQRQNDSKTNRNYSAKIFL